MGDLMAAKQQQIKQTKKSTAKPQIDTRRPSASPSKDLRPSRG